MNASNGAAAAKVVSANGKRRAQPREVHTCGCGARLSATNRVGLCAACTEAKTCPDCGCRISRKAARCRTCANAVYNADPALRAVKSATMRMRMADPAFRARHLTVTRAGTARLMDVPGEREKRRKIGREFGARNIEATRAPEVRARAGRAISATKLAGIPAEYRDMYRELKAHGYSADERRAMVLDRQERDRAEASTVVANNLERQRIRAERDKAQAY